MTSENGQRRQDFPSLLRQVREEKDWTQTDLAARLGASQGTISRWEKGERVPRRAEWSNVAQQLGITLPELTLAISQTAVPAEPPSRAELAAEVADLKKRLEDALAAVRAVQERSNRRS